MTHISLTDAPYLSSLSESARVQLGKLIILLQNARQNVTSIRDPEAIVYQHFSDSLAALAAEPSLLTAKRGIDIGSGGGFPLLPLAIALPSMTWIALESVRKKCVFIENTARELGLSNVQTECVRAEDAARNPDLRESADVATARAVGPIASLCEIGLPLLQLNGMLLLYKTEDALTELQRSETAVSTLGGTAEETFAYCLPDDRKGRLIILIRKIAPTPTKYPRPAGVPFKRPLA